MDTWIEMSELPSFWNSTTYAWTGIAAGVIAAIAFTVGVLVERSAFKRGDWDDDGTTWGIVVAFLLATPALIALAAFGQGHVAEHNAAVADLVVSYVEDTQDPMTVLSPIRVNGLFSAPGPDAVFDAVTADGHRVRVDVTWPEPDSVKTYRAGAELPDTFEPFTVTIEPDDN